MLLYKYPSCILTKCTALPQRITGSLW